MVSVNNDYIGVFSLIFCWDCAKKGCQNIIMTFRKFYRLGNWYLRDLHELGTLLILRKLVFIIYSIFLLIFHMSFF